MSLTWSIAVPRGGWGVAIAEGRVTEGARFDEALDLAHRGPLRLHLAGVTQISSTGVREWILFMRALDATPHPVELVEVSPTLVRQMNMIANFAGGATVRSVRLPYYCDACGHEQAATLELDSARDIPPVAPCAACGEEAEFDDIANNYLAFLRR
jgi:hypothetical protein